MTTRERAHAHLKARLRLPKWYGANLDALNDCLGEIGEPTHLVIRYAPELTLTLGDYGTKLLGILERAAEENPNLRIERRAHF